MRVAYVVSRFPKLRETFVLYELLELERLGVDVDLYPLLREESPVAHPEARSVEARARFAPLMSRRVLAAQARLLRSDPRRYLATMWSVMRGTWPDANLFFGGLVIFPRAAYDALRIQSSNTSHVHCHFASHPSTAGYVISRLTGISFSFTAHGYDIHVHNRMLAEKIREATFVITISEYNKRFMLDRCGESCADKITVIHCGVDTETFTPSFPASDREDGRLRIVSVGSLEEVKGQAHLLRACSLLRAEGFDISCTLVGDGPDRHLLEKMKQSLGLTGVVEFAGERVRPEIVSTLQSADVFVAPSVQTRRGDREGIPVALMEAMSCALPVVASRLSGIPELVRHEENGLLVTPGEPHALASAIADLRDPLLRNRLGVAARATVTRDFNLNRTAAALATKILERA